MSPYYFPIFTAALMFPLVAGLFSLPYAIHSYRRYGAVSLWRTLVLFSFVFYLQCAYYLIILPLPDPAAAAVRTGPFYDLLPFRFVQNFLTKSPFQLFQPRTWIPALKSSSFLEPSFNFFLLLPFGVYLAYYFRKNWKKVLLLSFLLSLFFEVTQLTGLFWLYPKPYRLFSADDLLLNSLGGLVGYFIFIKLLRFLPKRERIDQKSRERGRSVSFSRRAAALFLDHLLISFLQIPLAAFLGLDPVPVFGLTLCVYTLGFALLTKGRTPGKALVRVKVSQTAPGLPFVPAVALRYLLRDAVLFGGSFFREMVDTSEERQALWLALLLALLAFSLADFFYSLRNRRRLWYERLSRTENVSTVKRKG
ncbi:MAG: VanZ family protein [Clostridium sp.]|jgi:glycopeptide antibiotics resistance protein|nr:VanZ family protein [Clostridium sp.]